MRTLIVGGVAGGATLATRLRRLDEEGEIVIFERGPYVSFANCGLPYYVGDIISEKSNLLLQTPNSFLKKYNINVRVKHNVTKINREQKTIEVMNLVTNEVYIEPYDNLVLATGASPTALPIKGFKDSPIVKNLTTVDDATSIKNLITNKKLHQVAIIGAGFIGLELAENFEEQGVEVVIIEALDQILAPLDKEMATIAQMMIPHKQVHILVNTQVKELVSDKTSNYLVLDSGEKIGVDLVVVAAGGRPRGELAKDASLELNARGGIKVDNQMRTSDSNIFAVGDVVEIDSFIFKDKTMVPLAGPANKQARVAANVIAGKINGTIVEGTTYDGAQGTSIIKLFNGNVASTGANEKQLIARGLVKGKDYQTLIIQQPSHATYYSSAIPLMIKLIFSCDGKRIYGAQIIGVEGVDKSIDIIATVIRLNGSVFDLTKLDLAYAPPFSTAKSCVNMAGYVAENIIQKLVSLADVDLSKEDPDAQLLDVREDAEVKAYPIANTIHIPLAELRKKYETLDKHKEVIVFCAAGVRAYNAARILMQKGFSNVKIYPMGAVLYLSLSA